MGKFHLVVFRRERRFRSHILNLRELMSFLIQLVCKRFGYTPLEEAKAMANENIINAIEAFQKENALPDPVDNEEQLQTTVVQLTSRVQYLEGLLGEVSKIGGALKSHQTNASTVDPNVLRLAEKLSAIETK